MKNLNLNKKLEIAAAEGNTARVFRLIDVAFERGQINTKEARDLEAWYGAK